MKKRNNPKIEAMKQRSLILESERQNLHTPKFYITEQEVTDHDRSYDYKKDGDKYFFRKKGESEWKQTNNAAVKRVFGDQPTTPTQTNSKSSVKVPFKNTEEGNAFRKWVNDIHPNYAKEIKLDREGSHNNSYITKAWNKYGSEYQNKDKNKEKESENDNAYTKLKNNSTPENIAKMIKDSYGGMLGNDKEAWAQSAFEAITDKATYEKVKSILGEDPYEFVKDFMSTNKDYHNNGKTIDGEYKRLFGDVADDAEIIKKIESKSIFDKGPVDFIRDRFPNIVQFFDAKELTDKDFTTDAKKVIYDAIQSSIKRVGNVKTASTTYGDYGEDVASKFDNQKGSPSDWDVVWGAITDDDRFAMATLLGRFTWKKINDKTFKVTDKYDFKDPGYKAISGVNRKSLEGKSISELKEKYGLSNYEAARVAAWVEHPDNIPSKSLPIELTINVDDFA